jgi:hypothetical protein
MRCAAITRAGGRCQKDATEVSEYCWSHSPENANKRKQIARRGGKSKGASGEIVQIKREIRRIVEAVEKGQIESRVGGVVFQGLNLWIKALDTERNIRETEELAEMVEELWAEREGETNTNRKRRA